MRGLFWLREDLRFHDNAVLNQFCNECDQGLLIWTPTKSFWRAGARRRQFILASVLDFQEKAHARGTTCLISQLPAQDFFPVLLEQTQVQKIYCSSGVTHEEIEEEHRVRALGLSFAAQDTGSLIHPADLPMDISCVPESFTKFRSLVEPELKIRPPEPEPIKLPSWDSSEVQIESAPIAPFLQSRIDVHPRIVGGESFGLARLQDFIWETDSLKSYKQTRNGLMNWNDSSKLSPWLAVGGLSARAIYAEIRRYEKTRIQNESTYWLFFELLWRDYFRLIAQKWGSRFFTGMSKVGSEHRLKRSDEDHLFERWYLGQTDDDFVNANMHELNHTGWMSNRGRQNVASYLCKHLKVDWRRGAAYFEELLIDYDASSNWGNWAYQAGVGQDSRNRAFDTQKQAAFYDPDLSYRRRWLG